MIIQIRGTSGSGKSTIVRKVMDHYSRQESIYMEGRKQPLAYNMRGRKGTGYRTYILGHYEIPTGGADTLSNKGNEWITNHILEKSQDSHILYEGLMMSGGTKQSFIMYKNVKELLHIIFLNTPLDVCLDSVRQRRLARGNIDPLNPKTTTDTHRKSKNYYKKLKDAGVNAESLSREEAYSRVLELLLEPFQSWRFNVQN